MNALTVNYQVTLLEHVINGKMTTEAQPIKSHLL